MVPLRSVLCLQALVMWTCSIKETLAAPRPTTYALRDAKLREITAEYQHVASEPSNPTLTRNFTMELRSRQRETWPNEPFLTYVRDVLAKKCPHKPDNKTCADGDAPTQLEDEFDKLNISQRETIMRFMGGTKDTITCAQLVRINVGSDETPENVACVMYFYDSSSNDMPQVVPSKVN